jgi:uncharacterized protein
MTSQGRNVWYDLMTPDMEGAKTFYQSVIGWKAEPWADADPKKPYTIWMMGDQPIGGLMQLPADAQQMGAPPHWLAYTAVDDVDASAQKAASLGGKVLAPPWDIPKVGRVSVLADPQGAVFAIYRPEVDTPDQDGEQVGTISWAELNTSDYERAWKFYGALFGWKHRASMPMPGGLTYFMFTDQQEITKGGMSNVATMMKAPAHWLYYVTVKDIHDTIARVQKGGGKILNGPMEIPPNDLIAQCVDPQGAYFAIYMRGKQS